MSHATTVSGQLLYKFSIDDDAEIKTANGSNPAIRNFLHHNIAFLPQGSDDLMPGLTVYETMVYYFTLMVSPQVKPSLDGIQQIEDTLEFIGLLEHSHKLIDEMSGGEKRRLQIGIRLLDHPLALFLDEPDAGLDGTTSTKIILLLMQIAQKYNVTIVVSLHRPRTEVLEIADSILFMHGGFSVFQGKYSKMCEEMTSIKRADFVRGTCPVEYLLDHAGFDSLIHHVFMRNALRSDTGVRADLKRLAEASNPDAFVPARRLKQGSLLTCTTTLMSVFWGLVGGSRDWKTALAHVAKNHAGTITLVGVGSLYCLFLGRFLPVTSVDDIAVLHGVNVVWVSCTLTVFQVSVAGGLVEPEVKVFFQLMKQALVTPLQVVLFWLLRGFCLCSVVLAGWGIMYGGLGWQTEHAFNLTLVWFFHTLQTCMGAHVFQVWFGEVLSPVFYGLWCVVQILFCGIVIPLHRVLSAWKWVYAINPQYYTVSMILSMELAVGRPAQCGEYCAVLLESLYYEDLHMFKAVGILLIFLWGWTFLLFCAMWKIDSDNKTKGRFSVERAPFGTETMSISDLAAMHAASFRSSSLSFNSFNVRATLAKISQATELVTAMETTEDRQE